MKKEDVRQQHYQLPKFSELESRVGREYNLAYSKEMYLEGFRGFAFVEAATPKHVDDEGDPQVDSNQYDSAFLELYTNSLARIELQAASATPENARQVLEEILQTRVADDFFLQELKKREVWAKYVNEESVSAWYDDKRRAALRGLEKKGITLQEKVDKVAVPAAPKQRRFRLLYGLTIANTVLLAALAVGAITGAIYAVGQFRESQQSIEQGFDMKERVYIHQFYELADKIDPPKDEKDKETKRKTPLAERVEQVLQVYEQRLISQGEVRYQAISAGERQQWKKEIITMINEGKFDGAIEGYLKRKMQGK